MSPGTARTMAGRKGRVPSSGVIRRSKPTSDPFRLKILI
jgi:hypothetical protein